MSTLVLEYTFEDKAYLRTAETQGCDTNPCLQGSGVLWVWLVGEVVRDGAEQAQALGIM